MIRHLMAQQIKTPPIVPCARCGATQDEYLNRLYYAFDNTADTKLRQFLYQEIKKIHIQRGTW